jgi:hypothetical protein
MRVAEEFDQPGTEKRAAQSSSQKGASGKDSSGPVCVSGGVLYI